MNELDPTVEQGLNRHKAATHSLKHWLLLLSVLVAVCCLLAGCLGTGGYKTWTTEEIVEIYNEKYNDTFTLVGSNLQDWMADYSELALHSEALDSNIRVYVYGDGTMLDNYMPIKFRPQIEALLQPVAEEIYGSCRLVNRPILCGEEHFTPQMTLEDYLSDPRSAVLIVIGTNKDTITGGKDIAEFVRQIAALGIRAEVRVYYYDVEDISVLKLAKPEEIGAVFDRIPDRALYASMDDNGEPIEVEWRK